MFVGSTYESSKLVAPCIALFVCSLTQVVPKSFILYYGTSRKLEIVCAVHCTFCMLLDSGCAQVFSSHTMASVFLLFICCSSVFFVMWLFTTAPQCCFLYFPLPVSIRIACVSWLCSGLVAYCVSATLARTKVVSLAWRSASAIVPFAPLLRPVMLQFLGFAGESRLASSLSTVLVSTA